MARKKSFFGKAKAQYRKIRRRYNRNKKARLKSQRPVGTRKRKSGFSKGLIGAVAGEVLRDTGHIGKHIVKKLNEISKKRLGQYVKRASHDIDDHSYSVGMNDIEGKNTDQANRSRNRVEKRLKGISRAVDRLTEDGMGGVGGTPVNNAGSGAVAGLGTWKDGSQGEPGVNKKKRKTPLLTYKQFTRTKANVTV